MCLFLNNLVMNVCVMFLFWSVQVEGVPKRELYQLYTQVVSRDGM